MRCNPARWLWGLIPIAMLSWGTYYREREAIEADLSRRAMDALTAAGQPWAAVTFSGRDAVITGRAAEEEQPKVAFNSVRSVWGVRKADLKTDIAAGPVVIQPAIGPLAGNDELRTARKQAMAESAAPEAAEVQDSNEAARKAAEAKATEEAARKAAEAQAADEAARKAAEAKATEEAARKAAEAQAADEAARKAAEAKAAEEAARKAAEAKAAEEAARKAAEAQAAEEAARKAAEAQAADEAARKAAEAKAADEAARKAAEAQAADEAARKATEAQAAEEASRKAAEAQAADEAARRAAEAKAAEEAARKVAEAKAAEEAARKAAEAKAAEKAKKEAEMAAAAEKKVAHLSRTTTKDTAACEQRLKEAASRGTILFQRAKADIDAASSLTIARLAEIVKSCPGTRIEVEGHTDGEGEPERNQGLSERRARAVVKSLIFAGVPAERLTAVGYGAGRPVASNDTPEGMAQNRRIEFKVFAGQ